MKKALTKLSVDLLQPAPKTAELTEVSDREVVLDGHVISKTNKHQGGMIFYFRPMSETEVFLVGMSEADFAKVFMDGAKFHEHVKARVRIRSTFKIGNLSSLLLGSDSKSLPGVWVEKIDSFHFYNQHEGTKFLLYGKTRVGTENEAAITDTLALDETTLPYLPTVEKTKLLMTVTTTYKGCLYKAAELLSEIEDLAGQKATERTAALMALATTLFINSTRK